MNTAEEAIAPELVLIQYPGIIKNVDKALETLGGISTISNNHFSGRALELRHTPENPYSSSLVSEKKADSTVTSGTVRLVMKVRRKKNDPSQMDARCIGLVNYVYSFESMCDFQYLPIKKVSSVPEAYVDLVPRIVPSDLESAMYWWERPDPEPGYSQLFLPPYQFSRYNSPSFKVLARETDFSEDKILRKTGHGQNLRSERKALSITVHAADTFPEAPSQEAIDDTNFRCKNEEPHRLMETLFEERPMWTRVAIQYKTGLEDTLIKNLLQKFAFYIQSGPWGRLWCKFGYDPRADPSSKNYQTLMVSFRQNTKIPERQRLKVSAERAAVDETAPINFTYQPGRLPRVRQMWYSICDIQLQLAVTILKKDFSHAIDVASSGWIIPEKLDELRDLIKEDVKKTSQELDNDDDLETIDDL